MFDPFPNLAPGCVWVGQGPEFLATPGPQIAQLPQRLCGPPLDALTPLRTTPGCPTPLRNTPGHSAPLCGHSHTLPLQPPLRSTIMHLQAILERLCKTHRCPYSPSQGFPKKVCIPKQKIGAVGIPQPPHTPDFPNVRAPRDALESKRKCWLWMH